MNKADKIIKVILTVSLILIIYSIEQYSIIDLSQNYVENLNCSFSYILSYTCAMAYYDFEGSKLLSSITILTLLCLLAINHILLKNWSTYLGATYILLLLLLITTLDFFLDKDINNPIGILENLFYSYSVISICAITLGLFLISKLSILQIIASISAYIYFTALKLLGFAIVFMIWPYLYGGLKMATILVLNLSLISACIILIVAPLIYQKNNGTV